MKHCGIIYLFFVVFAFISINSNAQVANPCGVVAGIYPAAADSVVPLYTSIHFASTSTNATSVKWLYDGYDDGIQGDNWNYSVNTGVHKISLVAYNGNCTDTTTVVYFCAGTPHNIDSLLVANYGYFDSNSAGTCINNTADGGFLLGGYVNIYNCTEKGLIVKLKDKGCIDWSKYVNGVINCQSIKVNFVYASADTNYYISTNEGDPTYIKLDKKGNTIWTKKFKTDATTGAFGFSQLTEDKSGNLYGLTYSFNGDGYSVSKMDTAGNSIWNKFYRLGSINVAGASQAQYINATGFVWVNDKIFVSGNTYNSEDYSFYNFVTGIDATNGNRKWQYGYSDTNGNSTTIYQGISLYDSLLMINSDNSGQKITLIDQQGTVRKSMKVKFNNTYSERVSKAKADSKGNIYLMQWTEETLQLQPYFAYYTYFAKIDTFFTKHWGMGYSTYPRGYFQDAALGNDKSFAAVGFDFGFVNDGEFGSGDIRFIKIDTPIVNYDGNCTGNNLDYLITPETVTRYTSTYTTDSSFNLYHTDATNVTLTDAYIQSRYSCPDFIDSCSFMSLTGPVTLCSVADTYTYRLHKNKKCSLLPQWILPPGVVITNQTDSTLSVKYPALGTYKIIALLQSCIPVKDSLIVTLASTSGKLNVGNDTTICNNTTIVLHAGKTFLTYLWSDGSKDSVLTVSQPGMYWVNVFDSCNNGLKDSINISSFNLTMDIGPDRTKCNTDTVHLDAPDGFLNYSWLNNYYISSTTNQHVVVNPIVDTAYYIKAEKLPGCFVFDTVRIHVNTSPPLALGEDKSFCQGDSVLLKAANGFSTYQWSNGNLNQQIYVNTTGNYSLTGITAQGCKSYDTIAIKNMWQNPVPLLDSNANLCTGAIRILQPGNFATYIWQDGSTAPSFTVTKLGTYYVTVTDNHLCKGSATTTIDKLIALPYNFLAADTAICTYSEILLTTGHSYATYLWSNSLTTPSITITHPGLYWLQVSDQYNCMGIDSIMVLPKDCMFGLYIPTAFSPNADGKNDVFKALLFGNVLSFRWIIYNRFGQTIFTSNNPAQGWDGLFKGEVQPQGTYIWTCKYQLKGENEKVKSGSVILLR